MQTTTEPRTSTIVTQAKVLPDDRSQWPSDAGDSYRSVLRDLDRWSRENGFPMVTNGWVAEEAVRQGW